MHHNEYILIEELDIGAVFFVEALIFAESYPEFEQLLGNVSLGVLMKRFVVLMKLLRSILFDVGWEALCKFFRKSALLDPVLNPQIYLVKLQVLQLGQRRIPLVAIQKLQKARNQRVRVSCRQHPPSTRHLTEYPILSVYHGPNRIDEPLVHPFVQI